MQSKGQSKPSSKKSVPNSAKKTKTSKPKEGDHSFLASNSKTSPRGDSILDEMEANIANRWGLGGSLNSSTN